MKIKRINGYEIDDKIDQGSYGQVYQCHDLEDKRFALKFIRPRRQSRQQIINQTMNMKKADCATTVSHRKTLYNQQQGWACIIMELCDGSLQQTYKDFSQEEVLSICEQIIYAVKQVHERGVCHRDIKLQNLLYKIDQETRDLKIKIGDFGASKKILLESPMRSNVGTEYYKPLQMMKAQEYTQKVDSWAVGIVILELWLKKRVNQFYNGGGVPALVDNFPSERKLIAIKDLKLRNVTRKLLKKNPGERMSIVDAYKQLKKSQISNQIPQIQEGYERQRQNPQNNSDIQLIISPKVKLKQSLIKAAQKKNWTDLTTLPKLQLLQKKLQQLPLQIGTLTQLIQLDLFNNQLSYLPQSIGNLINLQKLSLGCNRLQKLPHTMSKLAHLTDLKLRDNKLTEFPQFIYSYTEIDYLTISGNRFFVDPRKLLGLKKLKWLVMNKDQLRSENEMILLTSSLRNNVLMLCGRGGFGGIQY